MADITITCPHCYEQVNGNEYEFVGYIMDNGDSHTDTYTCGNCGKDYEYTVIAHKSFTTNTKVKR